MGRAFFACLFACMLLPAQAHALELSSGVSVGGVLVGTDPRLAVTPHAGVSWRVGSVAFSVHEHLNLLPAVNRLGFGVYNQTSVAAGFAWEAGDVSLGPTLSIYSMPACSAVLCGRVLGLGAGGHAQINVYFAGPLGVSVSANLDWTGGASAVLSSAIAAMITAGPVFRWSPK